MIQPLIRTGLFVLLAAITRAATLHVAPTGDDTNSGTQAAPLHTLQAAANRLQPGDTCLIHGGVYRESVTVTHSGVTGAPIRFQAAEGEHGVIDGSDMLELKWEKVREGVFKASTHASFRQLFFDGSMMLEARWPNMATLDDLWKESRWAVASIGSSYGKVVDPKLAATGIDMTEATAVLNVYHQFYTWTRPVKTHRAGSDTFTYEKNLKGVGDEDTREYRKKKISLGIKPSEDEKGEHINFADDRYYLIGKLDLLDAPGEWFLDVTSAMLYFYPPGGIDPTGHRIAVKQRDYGLAAQRQHHVQVDGLTFFACGVYLEDCDDCLFENASVLYSSCCELERLANDDPKRELETRHPSFTGNRNMIRNCVFAYGSQTGMYVHGNDNLIENNSFHDFGWLASLNHVALRFSHSWNKPVGSHCVIRYNTLYNTGGPILHFNGQNNRIEYNDLYGGMRAAFGGNKDVAMLYTQKDVTGSKASHNWIHDSAGGSTNNTWGNGIGIRGDGLTFGYTVDHNVIWNCGSASIMMKNVPQPTPAQANAIRHNTTFGNSTMLQNANKVDIILAVKKDENKYSTVLNNCCNALDSKWGGKAIPEGPNIGHNLIAATLPLRNPARLDFRPEPGSALINTGQLLDSESFVGKAPDIGAYEANADEYWMPGRRLPAASRPLTADRATDVRLDTELLWLPGYASISNDVYFGTSRAAVETASRNNREYRGQQRGNIFHPVALRADTEYFWRIDTICAQDQIVKGPVWSFKTQ